jgi:hypothetical protein
MTSSPWPGKTSDLARITFELVNGFTDGEPTYTNGVVEDEEELKIVQALLEPLKGSPHTIASATMGEVVITLQDGGEITLRPVFHPARDSYGDLFFIDEWQYPMPPAVVNLLERWRAKRSRDRN